MQLNFRQQKLQNNSQYLTSPLSHARSMSKEKPASKENSTLSFFLFQFCSDQVLQYMMFSTEVTGQF